LANMKWGVCEIGFIFWGLGTGGFGCVSVCVCGGGLGPSTLIEVRARRHHDGCLPCCVGGDTEPETHLKSLFVYLLSLFKC